MSDKPENKDSVELVGKQEESKTPAEIGEIMPPEQLRRIQATFLSMVRSGNKSDKSILFEKMSTENISEYLKGAAASDEREFENANRNRFYYLIYVVLGLVSFGLAVVYLLPKDKELLGTFVNLIVGFAGGFGAGFGYKRQKDS